VPELGIIPPAVAREMEEFPPSQAETIRALAFTAAVRGEERDAALAIHAPRGLRYADGLACEFCGTHYPCSTARALGVTDA
jgi:hypothetical protein